MYTRTYTEERSGIIIPDSYGGTALIENIQNEKGNGEDRGKNPWEDEKKETNAANENEEMAEAFSPLSKIKVPSFLSNILGFSNFSLQKIGKEEILIIAAAAFLFFSKEGDRELAIILLLLLFLG